MDKLDELRLRYLNSLPQKGQDLQAHWQRLLGHSLDRSLLVELQQQVHRLSGSAPAYGFDEIGAMARPLDARMAEWLRSENAQRETADELVALLATPVAQLVQALLHARG